MFETGYLIMGLNDLSRVQKCWTLDDIAIFEKMWMMVKKSKRGEITINKKALQTEYRLGRRAVERSLEKLSRAGLIILLSGVTYSVASIPVILSMYYIAGKEDELTVKLNYYLHKPSGKFSIAVS